MLGTIYVGLAGMTAYSKGLDVISNNVANMNTPGYKSGIASFGDVMYRNGGGAMHGSAGTHSGGAGVHVNDDQQNFGQGQLRKTGNAYDAALEGNGFFVLERNGQQYYSRAGQFKLDKDNFLIESISGAKVMMSTESSPFGELSIDSFLTFPPKTTSEIKFAGNLPRTGTAQQPDVAVSVIDSSGNTQPVRVRLVRNADDPLSWNVTVLGAADVEIGSGVVRFNADGTPSAENAAITATLTADNVAPLTFTLNFGTSGSYAGATSLSGEGNAGFRLLRQDGVQVGTFSGVNFDERGNLEVTYSNSEKKKIGRLVLARFESSGDLTALGDGLYVTQPGRTPDLGGGLDFGLGRVTGGSLELSNVVLTEQFTDLIMVQRGYQASSQMTSVANEMLQQLLAMQDRK